MLLVLLSTLSFAQDTQDIDVPALNAQLFRPAVDSRYTLRTDDAELGPGGMGAARVLFQYVNSPFVYTRDDGERFDVVSDLVQLDLLGAYTFDRIRLGLDLPLYLRSAGELGEGETGLGDLGLDVKGQVLPGGPTPGLAVGARLFVPTSTVDAPLGDGGVGGEVTAIVDQELGPMLLAANLGVRMMPDAELENVGWSDALVARVGAGYALSDAGGLSADLAQQAPFSELGDSAAFPVEILGGGWARLSGPWQFRGGVGTGLGEGIGAPRARVVLAVSYEPEPESDTDGDGLLDSEDPCPSTAEDIDGYMDDDGCAEPTTVHLQFTDTSGNNIPEVAYVLEGPTPANGSFGDSIIQLRSGLYTLNATSDGFKPLEQASLLVPDGPPTELIQQLVPDELPATLVLRIRDDQGAPIVANVSLDEEEAVEAPGGNVEISAAPGSHLLNVTAPGYMEVSKMFAIEPDERREMDIVMQPGKVEIHKDRISLPESIYFVTNSAVIQERSYDLLEEVALLLEETPSIEVLRIEGHTDSRGSAEYNQRLSELRAGTVRAFLINAGVSSDRVKAVGIGETQPIDPQNTPEAWGRNRRVDMIIEDRAEPDEVP